MGSFGGTYFRPIKSSVTGKSYRDVWKEFPDGEPIEFFPNVMGDSLVLLLRASHVIHLPLRILFALLARMYAHTLVSTNNCKPRCSCIFF